VLAGFHEVIYTEGTKTAMLARQAKLDEEGSKKRQWRVSSTMFTHFRHDVDCGPMKELAHLYDKDAEEKYGRLTAKQILMQELEATGMV